MKNSFHLIAEEKKVDLGFQIGGFAIMLLLLFQLGPFALFFEALIQTISCCWWLKALKGLPQTASGRLIRKTMAVTAVLLLISMPVPGWNLAVCMLMLLLGPILGIAYFWITIMEIRYYTNARKPYYLL